MRKKSYIRGSSTLHKNVDGNTKPSFPMCPLWEKIKESKVLRQQRAVDETTLRELNSDMEKPFSDKVDFLLGEGLLMKQG